jgi:integrase
MSRQESRRIYRSLERVGCSPTCSCAKLPSANCRGLECLTCLLDLAVQRKYIPENPARTVKRFNERRERPTKQVLTLEQENRILNAASPHLRVGIILLVQTGGRTSTEGLRLRWDQVDWENRLIHFGNDVKTPGSSEPLPLTDLAFRVLQKWKEKSRSDSPYIFPSLRKPGFPIGSVKTTWRSTLRRAAAFSNLQPAARFLYTAKFGCAGCGHRTGHASHESGDETRLPAQHPSASSAKASA